MKLRDLKFGDKFRFITDIKNGIDRVYVFACMQNFQAQILDNFDLNECKLIKLEAHFAAEDVELVLTSKKHIYKELQDQWVRDYRVKEGDTVKLVKGEPPYPEIEGGDFVCYNLDRHTRKLYTIRRIGVDCVVVAEDNGPNLYMPYWSLAVQDEVWDPLSYADRADLLCGRVEHKIEQFMGQITAVRENGVVVGHRQLSYFSLLSYNWMDGPNAGKTVGRLNYQPRLASC